MKKIVCLGLMVIFMMGLSSTASARRFSVGAFGGMNIPIAQDDTKAGGLFGAKGRIPLLPFLALEPNFTTAQFGGKDVEVGGKSFSRKGGNFTSFGADLLIGSMSGMSKMRFYGLAGINSNTYSRQSIEDKTGLGLTIGTGFEFFPTEILSLELRARYHAIKLGDGGRSHLEVSGGLNYYFGKE